MNKLYFLLLFLAALLFLVDAVIGVRRDRAERLTVRLLPLALFCWVLVPLIQVGKSI